MLVFLLSMIATIIVLSPIFFLIYKQMHKQEPIYYKGVLISALRDVELIDIVHGEFPNSWKDVASQELIKRNITF